VYTTKASQQKLLTSPGEIIDAWASREMSVSFAFFERLRLRVTGIFLTEALVMRVNSTNVLDEGLRIGEIGRRMNSKVKLVEIGVYRK
jgi:hypothetical protein